MPTTDLNNLPSTPRAEYLVAEPDVQLIRDELAGTRRMHAQFKLYIPKWAAERPEGYKRRATAAKFYGAISRALSASVGMLFAREPNHGDTWAPEMEIDAENIDGKGTALSVFAKRHAEDGIADGLVAILVDFPPVPAGVTVTAATEATLNLRPKWAAYQRADILSWDTAIIDNVETLVQVVLRESLSVRAGRFGRVTIPVYRVCTLTVTPGASDDVAPARLAAWEVIEERKGPGGQVTLVSHGNGAFLDKDGEPFPEIPLAVGYAGRTDAILCAHPPLLDLAWCNLEHWQVANDLRYYEKLCAFPQPKLRGQLAVPPGASIAPALQLGPGVAVHLADEKSDFTFEELKGSSLQELRASLDEKKNEMGELGVSFLVKKTRGVESAEAKRIDAVAQNATLATAATGIEDMYNQALIFHARYRGIPKEQAPTLSINKEFEGLTMDAPTMIAYAILAEKTGFPLRLILEELQRGGRISPDQNLDVLEQQIVANKRTQDDQARLDAEAAAAAKAAPMAAA